MQQKHYVFIIGFILVTVIGWYYYGQNAATQMGTGGDESVVISYGEIKVTYDNNGDSATVTHDGETFELQRAISASGTRYANSDETVVFWEHQGEGTLEIDGVVVANSPVKKQGDPDANRYDFADSPADTDSALDSTQNPMFQNNELGGEMIELANPVSDEETDPVEADAAAGTHNNPYFQDNSLAGDMIEPQNETDETTPGIHDEIIGLSVAEAEVYARTNQVVFRTGTIDGESMPLTMDYRPGRITAEIKDGVVVGYTVEEE